LDKEEAKRRARSGPLLLLARRAFSLIVTFVSTITIARLISPAEYGLANMALVILGFAQIFRDFGLTNAVLRKGVISLEEMSFIFWFNAGTTIGLALIIAAIAPLAAQFYHQPIVTSIILVSLIGFVLGGLSSQHNALMGRDLRFGTIALIDSASLLVGFLTTLTLAALYHNVWSIVFGMVAQSLLGSGLSVWLSGWRPGRLKKIEDLRSLLKFGGNSSVFSISVFLSQNSAPILIGHFLGAGLLGQYTRADALCKLPITNLIQPITQATMPVLTRLRPYPDEYRLAYISLVQKLCTVLFPLSIILVFSAAPLVRALLGDRWETAGYALAALAPTLVATAVASAAGDLFITQDRADELRTIGLIETVLRVGAVIIGVQFGIVATALAYTLSTMLAVSIRLVVAGRKGPVSLSDQLGATLPGIPIAVGSAIGCAAADVFVHFYVLSAFRNALVLLTTGCIGGLVAALCVPVSKSALLDVLEIFQFSRVIRLLNRQK
jgi:PST family polysaccharide transporter